MSPAWHVIAQHRHRMAPPGIRPLCPHTDTIPKVLCDSRWHTTTQATLYFLSSSSLWHTHTHAQLYQARVKLWRVAGGVSHGAGWVRVLRDKSGDSEGERGRSRGLGSSHQWMAASSWGEHAPAIQPLLSPLPKVELFSSPLRPSFQEQSCMKEQLFEKRPNN